MPRRIAGELLLIATNSVAVSAKHRSGELFVLNATGEYLWECLAAPASIGDLARQLAAEFDIDEQAAEADAQAFVQALTEIGAVTTE